MKRILLAGLLIALCCLVVPAMAVAANYAFTPNMGEASVSKIDAVANVEIARYYTAPRYRQVISDPMADIFGVDPGPFPVTPVDWRTSRLIVGPDGSVWVLNTGADCFNSPTPKYSFPIQGTLVRIEGDTSGWLEDVNGDGLIKTATTKTPLTFGTDDAVQVFAVGSTNDIPRTLVFDKQGNLWIGFHMANKKYGYFQKFTYDACTRTLTPGMIVTTVADPVRLDIAPYNCDIDNNGVIWFSSYGSTRVGRFTGTYAANHGMYSFDTDGPGDPVVVNHTMTGNTAGTAYGVVVDDSVYPDVRVYATSLEDPNTATAAYMWVWDSTVGDPFNRIAVTGADGMRGLAFDNYGTLWIASSSNGRVCWYNPDDGTSGYYPPTGTVGTTPVGVGKDAAGDMWLVVRDSNKLVTFTPTENPAAVSGFFNVIVGPQPYVYGNFIRGPVYYQICGYKYDASTDPEVGWAGWTINLYKEDELIDTEVTDATGHYCFTGLEAGTYKVTETANEEWGHLVDPAGNEYIVTLPDSNPACPDDDKSYDFHNWRLTTGCATGWAAETDPGTDRFVPKPGDWATYIDNYVIGSGTEVSPVVYPIYAGQTYHAGDIYVYDSTGTLYVKFVVKTDDDEYKPGYCGGWGMNAYYLQVVDEFDGFNPYRVYNKKTKVYGGPIPGQFDIKYKGDLIPGTDYIEIDISSYTDADLYIAAHAGMCWQGYPCDVFDPTP